MKINVHAGHNPAGEIACGAVGLLNESIEDRIVKDKVISLLRNQGHTVYDCTIDNGISQSDVLKKIITKCNAHTVDLDVSIHFNAGASDKKGNGMTTGTEVLIYSASSKAKIYAQNTVNAITSLGFKNRGIKYSTNLYFLRKSKATAMLIECCFVDDKDDTLRYNADKMAQAIVNGICGNSAVAVPPAIDTKFLSNGIDYSLVFDPTYYVNKYADLKVAFGTNPTLLFNHFISNGIKEGRQAIATFNVNTYKSNYPDLMAAFGNNLSLYYSHYCTNGKAENRKAV